MIDELLQVGRFALCICDCRRREIGKKLVHCRNVVCCLVFELICGPILVPKQLRFLCSKLSGANHDIAGVEVPAVTIAREGSLHDPFAQWSILQRAEWRLPCGVLKLNDELAFLVLGFRRIDQARNLVVGKTSEIVFAIDHNGRSVFLLQNILFKLRLQRRELGVNLLQFLFLGIGQFRTRAREIFVITLQQISRFGIEPEFVTIVVKLLDAPE